MPKVTVIIPAYNAMTYLPHTVDSVFWQTFNDWELLIINDGSSDNIVEWAAQIENSRVKLISQLNQGVSTARNTGITQAQGEYIAFLDADDLWQPTKLEKQLRRFQEYSEAGLVYTWTKLINRQGKPINRILASSLEGNVWEKILVANMIGNGSAAMVRRSCLDTIGGFDPNLSSAADRDLWIRIASKYSFAVVKEPLTLWRQHSDSMSKQRQAMLEDLRRAIEKNFATVPLGLLHLRNQSYCQINLRQAWNSVDAKNLREAKEFQRQAYLHYPPIGYSENYLRLSLAILMMSIFGDRGYENVRQFTRSFYRFILNFSS
jgi:glycosyltransferase involved in cell wall biosynthesis